MIHSHGACGATWTGLETSHCAADNCHRTFSSISAFDRHQTDAGCVDPATRGLVPVDKPWGTCWSWPSTDRRWVDARRSEPDEEPAA